jgi:hypothetical protein
MLSGGEFLFMELRKTVYDINPDPDKKYYKIKAEIVCIKCKKNTIGYIILDRVELKVVDTSGFMIFDEPRCDNCSEKGMTNFSDMVKEACKELGTTPEALGIVDRSYNNNNKGD